MKYIELFESFAEKAAKQIKAAGAALAREGKETVQAAKILKKLVNGEEPSESEIKFLKSQSVDIVKVISLIGLQAIPGSSVGIIALEKAARKYGLTLLPVDQSDPLIEKSSDIMYHVSLILNRGSIEKKGLNASGPSAWSEDEYPKGTYLWTDLAQARKYGFGNGDPYDIWEVNTAKYDVKEDPITKGAFYIDTDINNKDVKLAETHKDDVTNPIKENMQVGKNSVILIKGIPLEDGTSRLYAFYITGPVMHLDRLKSDNTAAQDNRMVTLQNEPYRIAMEDGKAVAKRVDMDINATAKALGMKPGNKLSVGLNSKTGKTPLYWDSLQYTSVNKMVAKMSDQILKIPGIRWTN